MSRYYEHEVYCRVWTKYDPYGEDMSEGEWDFTPETELHRLDGPAEEFADGHQRWWINGKELPADEVKDWLEENNIDLTTTEGQIAFKLRWM